MSFKRYGLITDTDEKYYMEYCESPNKYEAFKIPLKLGANRFIPSKYHNHWRSSHNGRNYEEDSIMLLGLFLKR